jgi:hypothetical protein
MGTMTGFVNFWQMHQLCRLTHKGAESYDKINPNNLGDADGIVQLNFFDAVIHSGIFMLAHDVCLANLSEYIFESSRRFRDMYLTRAAKRCPQPLKAHEDKMWMDDLIHQALEGKFDNRGLMKNDMMAMNLLDIGIDFAMTDGDAANVNIYYQMVCMMELIWEKFGDGASFDSVMSFYCDGVCSAYFSTIVL